MVQRRRHPCGLLEHRTLVSLTRLELMPDSRLTINLTLILFRWLTIITYMKTLPFKLALYFCIRQNVSRIFVSQRRVILTSQCHTKKDKLSCHFLCKSSQHDETSTQILSKCLIRQAFWLQQCWRCARRTKVPPRYWKLCCFSPAHLPLVP